MNASIAPIASPARAHWDAAQLAEAVPLRLHELFARVADAPACNDAARAARPRAWHGAYRCTAPLPERVRVN